jgi:hypothetical protein
MIGLTERIAEAENGAVLLEMAWQPERARRLMKDAHVIAKRKGRTVSTSLIHGVYPGDPMAGVAIIVKIAVYGPC